MRKNKRKNLKSTSPLHTPCNQQELLSANCYQGQDLSDLLQKLSSGIELAKQSRGGLREKIWMKVNHIICVLCDLQQQFSIGVNDVTRVLERMPRRQTQISADKYSDICSERQFSHVQLQAVLLVADCSPRLLTKHIPSLASSREVPVLFIKDDKGGSFRLGELVNVKTALAIGVKAKGSRINEAMNDVLQSNQMTV